MRQATVAAEKLVLLLSGRCRIRQGQRFTFNLLRCQTDIAMIFLLAMAIVSITLITPANAFQTTNSNLVDDLIFPHDTDVFWVGRDIVQNGHRMQVIKFRSRLDSNEFIEFFKNQWLEEVTDSSSIRSSDGSNVVLSAVGQWKTIGVLDSDRQIVVQVQRSGFSNNTDDSEFLSTGFISSMDLRSENAYTRVAFPHPSGSVLISTTHSNDSGSDTAYTGFEATTSIVMVEGSVEETAAFYQSQMTRNGWALQAEHSTATAAAMMYTRSGETSELSLNRQSYGQVLVTLNRTSKGRSQ